MNTIAKLCTFIVSSFVGIVFYLRYSMLSDKNKQLQEDVFNSKKLINIHGKILDVTKNTKHTDFNGIIERLRDEKL